jgi:hypothetical protein
LANALGHESHLPSQGHQPAPCLAPHVAIPANSGQAQQALPTGSQGPVWDQPSNGGQTQEGNAASNPLPARAKVANETQTSENLSPSPDGPPLPAPPVILSGTQAGIPSPAPAGVGNPQLKFSIEATEIASLSQAINRCRTTREMAKYLGISQASVSRKLKKYGLKPPSHE